MADNSQKTEQPTQRRLQKAREEGQFPSCRQFIAGVQFCVFLWLLESRGGEWLRGAMAATRALIQRGFGGELDSGELSHIWADLIVRCFMPLLIGGAVLVVVTLALQLGFTRMGFTVKKLAPDPARLNPMGRLKEMPHNNMQSLVQALILLPVFGGAIYAVTMSHLDQFLMLPLTSMASGLQLVNTSLSGLMWKAAGLFMLFGCVDLAREFRRHTTKLRMSKQEIKDEMKDSEGNPQIKAKIRSIRRDQARRRMMQAVPTATAVVVNPTHFAVALRYIPETMVAPVVVAKGKNYLALRIRQKAVENLVPLIENPPLAQALYKGTDVGQEIPPHLYRAVAELLAYVFKIMRRK